MNIHLKSNDPNADAILKEGMERINLAVKGRPHWEKDHIYGYYKTECEISEKEIMPVFYELLQKYPQLDIYAVYSYEIREDDRSAQWWVTTTIRTDHSADGNATLVTDSSTNWF